MLYAAFYTSFRFCLLPRRLQYYYYLLVTDQSLGTTCLAYTYRLNKALKMRNIVIRIIAAEFQVQPGRCWLPPVCERVICSTSSIIALSRKYNRTRRVVGEEDVSPLNQ